MHKHLFQASMNAGSDLKEVPELAIEALHLEGFIKATTSFNYR